MAIIEMQMNKNVFFDIIKAEFMRIPVPSNVVNELATLGKQLPFINKELLIERIEFPEVTVVSATPKLGPVPKEKLHLQVKIQIFLTTFDNAKLAGHLAAPATLASPIIERTVWISLELSLQRQITYRVVDSDSDFYVSGTLNLDIHLPIDNYNFAIWATAILAIDDVVVFRMSPDEEYAGIHNPQALLDWRGGNRLGMSQWGIFIDGTVFSHLIAKKLNRAVEQLAKTSSDPKIEVTYPKIDPSKYFPYYNSTWILPQRYAEAIVKLNAIDAGLLDADITIELKVILYIQPYLNKAVKFITRIQWNPSDNGGNVIANNLRNVFKSQEETAYGDDFVEFSITHFLDAPRSHVFSGHITGINVDDNGLAITGALQVRPRPVAMWNVTPPFWSFSGSCQSKQVKLELKPPSVDLIGSDPYFIPLLLLPPRSSPLLFWEPFEQRSMPGALPVTFELEFRPASHLLGEIPYGIEVSAYLYTNLGVRWINFGTIPPKPVVSEKELLERTSYLISKCMAISDRWGMGVMNIDWLVDPTDLAVDFGFPPLQEWFVLGNNVREVDMVQLTAVRHDGQRRSLGSASVAGGMLLLQHIVTDADETLELRTDVPMVGPAPQIMRRWIAPQRIISFDRLVASFALDGSFLKIFHDDGSFQEMQLDGDSAETVYHITKGEQMWRDIERGNVDYRSSGAVRNFSQMEYRNSYYVKTTALHKIVECSDSIAVLHDNKIIIGVAGRFKSAVSAIQEKTGVGSNTPCGKNLD